MQTFLVNEDDLVKRFFISFKKNTCQLAIFDLEQVA